MFHVEQFYVTQMFMTLDKLSNGAKQLGFPLSEDEARRFELYLAELLKWNAKVNLTAITEPDGIIIKHFLDSLALLGILPPGRLSRFTACDIGSGAGFPGLALKIVLPEMDITLVEPARKKAAFLRHVIRTLGLSGANVLEEAAGAASGRTVLAPFSFDVVFSRAFKSFAELLPLAGPLLTGGGYVAQNLSLKDAGGSIARSRSTGPGWEIEREEVITLPFSDIGRRLMLLRKI